MDSSLDFCMLFVIFYLIKQLNGELFSNPFWNEASIYEFIEEDVFFEVLYPEELRYTYRLRKARDFGSTLMPKMQEVKLVLADPIECCSYPYNAAQIQGAIALVSRGLCSFLSKGIKAEEAGASAFIVMDNDEENDLYIEMKTDETDRDINIPGFFLLGSSGQMIKKKLEELNEVAAIINIPVNLTNVPVHKLNQPPWLVW